MKKDFKKYDIIKTTEAVSGNFGVLRKGRKGTIVEIYKNKDSLGYEVEFTSPSKEPTLVTLTAKQITLPTAGSSGNIASFENKPVASKTSSPANTTKLRKKAR